MSEISLNASLLVVSFLTFGYLLYALLFPERF
jgi:K+-transporting ATPase KdpF subunit